MRTKVRALLSCNFAFANGKLIYKTEYGRIREHEKIITVMGIYTIGVLTRLIKGRV